MDKLTDECGVIAVYSKNCNEVSGIAFRGLNAIQHRGQESCGIAVAYDGIINCCCKAGLATEVFDNNILSLLKGNICLGHVKYSTAKDRLSIKYQPYVFNYRNKSIAVAFNGGLINAEEIKQELWDQGEIFDAQSDAELIAYLIALNDKGNITKAVEQALNKIKGAYALGVLTENSIIAARDPFGIRPMVFGKIDKGYVFASESCAIDLMDGELIGDIQPGEILVIDNNGLTSIDMLKDIEPSQRIKATCIFEYIYFARPDSTIDGKNVYKVRELAGEILAMEKPVEADIVLGVPDSGTPSAIGFATGSQIPYSAALIKNKYIGRTFIEPTQEQRESLVKMKLNPIKEIVKGKRIVLVDDSIVRGTTMKSIISVLKNCGALEVHLRISSPPVYGSCFFGVDTPDKKDLIANEMSIEEICEVLGADSLGFISTDGLLASVGGNKKTNCIGCLNGIYPMEIKIDVNC